MSFLTNSDKNNAALQIDSWNDQAIASMEQAKLCVGSIATQLEAMRTNSDYTPEDVEAVELLLSNLIEVAKSLIPA